MAPQKPKVQISDIAALTVQVEAMANSLNRVLLLLEGNGKPGLLERTKVLELGAIGQEKQQREFQLLAEQISTKLGTLDAERRKDLADFSRDLSNQLSGVKATVDDMHDAFKTHTDPDNLQHKTIALLVTKTPGTALKWAAVIGMVVYILSQSGVLKALFEFLARTA